MKLKDFAENFLDMYDTYIISTRAGHEPVKITREVKREATFDDLINGMYSENEVSSVMPSDYEYHLEIVVDVEENGR